MIHISNLRSCGVNLDIQYLEDGNNWIEHNGRMLFHLVSDRGDHLDGYYIMGFDIRGLTLIPFSNGLLDNNRKNDKLIIDGVDIV